MPSEDNILTRRSMTRGLVATALAVATVAGPLLALPRVAAAQEKPAPAKKGGLAAEPNKVRGDEITPAQKAAVEKGLDWLARRQNEAGGFGGAGFGGYSNHAGITALAGLAFMQAGNLPGRGKYGKEVKIGR